jgi:hypothetical protein
VVSAVASGAGDHRRRCPARGAARQVPGAPPWMLPVVLLGLLAALIIGDPGRIDRRGDLGHQRDRVRTVVLGPGSRWRGRLGPPSAGEPGVCLPGDARRRLRADDLCAGVRRAHADQVHAVGIERFRRRSCSALPADSCPVGHAHHRLEGRNQAAGTGVPLWLAPRPSTRSTGSRLATTTKL